MRVHDVAAHRQVCTVMASISSARRGAAIPAEPVAP
jgi:dihydropteroate synthase